MSDLFLTLRISSCLISIWGMVSTAEWIANRAIFCPDGILPAGIIGLGRSYRHRLVPLMDGGFLDALLAVRLLTSTCLFVTAAIGFPTTVLLMSALLLTGTTWLLTVRSMFGGDGSDQMGLIVSIAVTAMAAGNTIHSDGLFFAGVLLAGGQLTLSYFVAGFSKWISKTWRSGRAMAGVMSTFTYGDTLANRFAVNRTRSAKLICWVIFVGETIFPLALLLPHGALVWVMALFFLFHVSNAYFMGLNAFVWSFTAAYPAVFALSAYLRSTMI